MESNRIKPNLKNSMENFNLDELMDLAEAYEGPMIDAIYRRLIDRDFALEDPEVVMLLTALINILGHDNRGDRPTEVLLMAAYEEWEVHHRDHEGRTGCKLDRVAFMEEVWTVVQSYGTQSILKTGLN